MQNICYDATETLNESRVLWKEQFQRLSKLLNNGREDPPLLLIGLTSSTLNPNSNPLTVCLYERGGASRFKNKINADVFETCILSFGQQELPKMVAQRLAVNTL